MKKIKDIMTASPQSCSKNETIKMVASQMSKANIGFLPVLDENREVVGTITDRDVALAIGNTNQPIERLRAQDIMNTGAHTVTPDDEVDTALEIMRTRQVGRLPVVDQDKKLKGVVSLLGIARKLRNDEGKNEFEQKGKENILDALHAIAERNKSRHSVGEYMEE